MHLSTHALIVAASTAIAAGAAARQLPAQQTGDHAAHAAHAKPAPSNTPGQPGQDAYAAITEVVRILEADSTTDWSKVNLEALRAHLIAMNDVTLRSSVTQASVPGGARMEVTGDGRVAESIRSMLRAHAPQLEALGYRASVAEIPRGMQLTVTAADPADARAVAKIRGLGFIGLLTAGDHHGSHHLALARGQHPAGHQH